MRTRTLIGAGLALALVAGLAGYSYTASAQGGPGWGPGWMMGGGGPGYHMRGWGGGPGGGSGEDGWICPGFGRGEGYGPGPGYRMRGWGGGPGMMGGYGPGYSRSGDAQSNQVLSVDDVKARMERWLNWRGNARLKVGDVKEKDADTITADIVTKDNSLVQRFIIDRHTGATRQDNS